MESTQTAITGAPIDKGGPTMSAVGICKRAARHAKVAVEALANVAADKTAPACDRVRAAETLLNHATMQQAE